MQDFINLYNYAKDLNILYVEDNKELLESTQDLFENFFNSVSIAYDGEEALSKFLNYKNDNCKFYDLVITDINMPKIDGFELIKGIKKINNDQAIIVISAYSDSDNLIRLLREGISNFITKPIMPKQLISILYKTSKEIYNEKMKNEFLIGQAKLASMGEMIDTIAHQWQSPISVIKMQAQMLEMEIDEEETIKKEDIKECIDKQTIQINHIIATLNEFRSFFRPSQELVQTSFKNLIDSTLVLLKDSLIHSTVSVDLKIEDKTNIKVIPNEFIHVLINIITNSLDEFNNKKIQNPNLIISTYEKDDDVVLELSDNAGGIPDEIIDEIFKANFTTKKSTKGTGIGLYLVSLILQKIDGKISVKNIENGANFTILLKKDI